MPSEALFRVKILAVDWPLPYYIENLPGGDNAPTFDQG